MTISIVGDKQRLDEALCVTRLFPLPVFRGREDFMKCRRKYGPYWEMYCVKVPHAYIPGLW